MKKESKINQKFLSTTKITKASTLITRILQNNSKLGLLLSDIVNTKVSKNVIEEIIINYSSRRKEIQQKAIQIIMQNFIVEH